MILVFFIFHWGTNIHFEINLNKIFTTSVMSNSLLSSKVKCLEFLQTGELRTKIWHNLTGICRRRIYFHFVERVFVRINTLQQEQSVLTDP